VRFFETGAAHFPRSDFRPSWLYWSARAKEQLGDAAGATARYTLAATDYQNSYYGRLALRRLKQPAVPPSITEAPLRPALPPTQPQIALLLSLGLHDLALAETQFARRQWGESPALTATAALAQHRAGRLRLGINAMKRAYPQYLASGGESLPPEVLRVLFPLDYWPLLEASAARHGLDTYLVAALAAQESTFDAGIRSSAGAIGLMQIMPATGRGFARRLGIQPFSTGRLTEPAVNATIGTQYLADLMEQFGGAAYALAAYNAGEHRVVRWRAERPGLPEDEWVDDIPFPETQNYVKRILGTAEDYRRLYGGGLLTPLTSSGSSLAPLTPAPPAAAPVRKTPPKKTPPKRRSSE
jgi:soluble lytic murein transglycosylase